MIIEQINPGFVRGKEAGHAYFLFTSIVEKRLGMIVVPGKILNNQIRDRCFINKKGRHTYISGTEIGNLR